MRQLPTRRGMRHDPEGQLPPVSGPKHQQVLDTAAHNYLYVFIYTYESTFKKYMNALFVCVYIHIYIYIFRPGRTAMLAEFDSD